MELRQLRYFVAIARGGSFHAASRRLYVAQPALSIQIAKLEEELGCRLLERRSSGVVPTAPGEELLAHADRILGAIEEARRAIARHGNPQRMLRIGLPPVTSRIVTVQLLEAARAAFPKVRLEIVEVMTGVLREMLKSGSVDLALLNTLGPGELPAARRLGAEDLYVAGSRTLAATWGETMTLAGLADVPLLVSTRGNSQREVIERLAARHSVPLKIAAEVDSTARLSDLLQRGTGAVVGPRLAFADVAADNVMIARLLGGEAAWETNLVTAVHCPRNDEIARIEGLIADIMANYFADLAPQAVVVA